MRYAANSDTEPKFLALLDSAKKQPIFIERDGQEVAVLLSARQYDWLRGKAVREFNEFCDSVAKSAAAKGLTEEKLEEILNSD
jgi:prevent-host-death family protein